MATLELTREDIIDNEQITIPNLNNPLTVDDGDYFHVYIGISATSLCKVDLKFTDDFTDYGTILLERLTHQTNMYALHFSLDSYLYDYQNPQYRNSEFFVTAYTCGELSEEAEFSINQKGCKNTCTITWKNDNTVLDIDTVQVGSIPVYGGETPTKQNPQPGYSYEFSGWNPAVTSVTGDTTYTAQFEEHARGYTVSFEMNGYGTQIPSQSVPYDGYATRPPEPVDSNEEYAFYDWYSNSGLTNAWDFEDDSVEGNMTLYAKWEYACVMIKCIITPNEGLGYASSLEDFDYGPNTSFLSAEQIIERDYSECNILCDSCITELGNNEGIALQDENLIEVILPDTLTILRDSNDASNGIFSYSGLRKANLSNITKIGAWTFEGCEFYAILPNTSSEIDYYNNLGGCAIVSSALTEIGKSAFGSNTNLMKVELPIGVTKLERTFHGCSSLTSVTIPNSVTSIENNTFYDCSSLTSITIPNSVTSIGNGAFAGCSSLTSIIIPNRVTSIGNQTFSGCSSLTSITIPNRVTSIGDDTFSSCSFLISVTIGESVKSIGNQAFEGCKSLTSITIPNSVTSIGRYAFYGTGIYNNAANWKNGALYINNCLIGVKEDFMGDYTIKAGTRLIAGGAFQKCSSLTSVTIPNSVISIGEKAFYGCTSLTSVTIPNSVTSIDGYVFSACTSLRTVTCKNENPPTLNNVVFDNETLTNGVLHVPSGCADTYSSRGWTFSNIVEDA